MEAMSATTGQPTPAIDPARCPVCGQPNRCAMGIAAETGGAQPPCWCMGASFPPALRSAVPAPARGLACICAGCSARALAKENTP